MKHFISEPALSDVYIDRANPNKNFSNSRKLWIGYFCGDMEYRTLLKFGLKKIPAGARIISAKIKLYIDYSPDCHTTLYLTPYMIMDHWSEKTVTWNNAPSVDYGTSGWTEGIKKPGWYQLNVTDIIKAWINEDFPNYGLMLMSRKRHCFDNKRVVGSRDIHHCHSSMHPSLTVEYDCVPSEHDIILTGRRFTERYETVKTTDKYLYTPGYDTSQESQLTFFIKNQGDHPASVALEVSPDNVDFLTDGKEIEVLPGCLKYAVPYIYAKYTRLRYKSANAGQSTHLDIAFQAQV